ncbi:AT-hook motif nuclear-localized protein 9 isoform X1 [Musa acuminata AAA Group]|uniref:AT-hook motif nuclear-localized protein 9 isoform X1 n=2 Tax=Musa acuminata AAA Group TaxID=214697 RepID=UPI0031DF3AFA
MASEFLDLSLDSRILEERRTSSSSGACMDGRDAMAMSGPAYYIAHRGIPGSLAGSQPGLHAAAQPGVRSLPNPGTILVVPSSGVGSAAFQVESPPAASLHGGGGGGLGEGASQTEPVKRKRGRPRKYGPDGSVALALSPISSSAPPSATVIGSETASGAGAPTLKRGRGRPPGTGRKQQLASLGEWVVGSAGMGFTPHVITIAIGEDIAAKIMSFSQQGPRAVCILSANGAVSTVTLRQSATSGGTVTYEGRFEILCLSGSYMLTDNGNGSRSRTGGLSISLSSPDGRVIGGGVAGLLIAATPVQVIVGSFIYAGSKARSKQKASNETGAQSSELQVGDEQSAPYAAIPDQNVTPSSVMGGWPGSRQLDMRNAHIDIDLTRG